MKKGLTIVLGILLIFAGSTTLFAGDFEIFIAGKKLDLSAQEMEENQLVVSVRDENGDPIRGLKADDFAIGSGIRKVRLRSVEPLETSKDLPLNMVLVVDNSFSMKERQAVKPLLAALNEVFKTVRAIDNVHIVVFDDKQTISVGNRELHGKRFQSSDGAELGQFMDDAFNRSSSGKTYLNEAMLAGLDIITHMPAKEQKFMVVFSDGEDLNSTFDETDVAVEAFGIENFEAYCIDYMPGTKKNDFLTSFARTNNGRIWKATSASELLPIFQAFSSTLLYRYIITYEYDEPIRIHPLDLNFDILTTLDGAALSNKIFFEAGKSEIPSKYVCFKNRSQTDSFDPKTQVSQIERYLNILNIVGRNLRQTPQAGIQIVGCNSNTGVEKGNLALSQRRGEAVKEYLQTVWEIESERMAVVARNLPANFAPAGLMGGRAENQQVEIIYTPDELQSQSLAEFVDEAHGVTQVTIKTYVFSEHGFADWELALYADEQPLKTLKGKDAPESEYTFFLDDLGRENLVGRNTLEARIKVVDLEGRTHEAASDFCHIRVARKEVIHELIPPPRGGLVLEPETLVIEEITTLESAPLLNYIFFDTGGSEIPERYSIFSNQGDTKNFDESKLKGVMQKYQHGLNIIGKRLNETPEADILIVGCNSNHGIERGKTDLSRGRAEAVRAYLRYIWGVHPSRMQVEARNLPAAASSSGTEEGREENQRVEIYSAHPLVLDTINSNYVEAVSNADSLKIIPDIHTGYDLSRWTIQLSGGGNPIESLNGSGELSPHYSLDMNDINLYEAANFGQITAAIEVVDKRGQTYRAEGVSSVQFVKRSERLAQREGYKVLEKYALILFDFNSAEIKERNKIVLDRILARINEVANASVRIVGHTDTIGKEEYNLALSKRRARAAYEQILAGGVILPENVTYEGAGPHDPLYDNAFPGGRALNRTVTVTLEYEQKE